MEKAGHQSAFDSDAMYDQLSAQANDGVECKI